MSEALLETTPHAETWLAAELARSAAEGPAGPGFLAGLRREAAESFGALGLPTTSQEEWRFTNLAALAKSRFVRAGAPAAGLRALPAREAVLAHAFEVGHRLVFVDGRFSLELSALGGLPPGVVVDRLASVLAREPERLEAHLGRHARHREHPFVALNTALFTDGAYIELPPSVVVEAPIQILHVLSGAGGALATFPRNLIVAGANSQAVVIETFVGLAAQADLTCAVTEVVLGEGAVLDHSKVQKESTAAFHLATLQFYHQRASTLVSQSISTGGALVRNDVNAVLDGEGVDCTLNGLYVLRGTQFLDNHMRVDHLQPHCASHEMFKGILDERSRAVFNGRIFVAKGAQKTDAKQSSRNLLLSREAMVNANPQLEIFADDVKCTHGSTVGELDEDAVFYLRSRGIGLEAARSLLTYAFASDIIERIRVEPVRNELTEFLFERLPRGEVVRQAV